MRDNGILHANTAFGKTVTALALIAERRVNTLIIVDRVQLMDQWKERISVFLNIPAKERHNWRRKKEGDRKGRYCRLSESISQS